MLDPETRGLFASIGIEKGKPFNPDARMKRSLPMRLPLAMLRRVQLSGIHGSVAFISIRVPIAPGVPYLSTRTSFLTKVEQ